MTRTASRLFRVTLAVAALGLSLQALADPRNPPPANKLEGYAGYELKPVTLNPELAGKKNVDKVLAKVEENVQRQAGAVLSGWAVDAANPQKLVLEPYIESLHKPSGANRFFAGAAAGSGRILLKVKITEQPSGKVIAEPEFYRHANGAVSAWTFGAHDNAMLDKVAALFANYLSANYTEAVGGETGFEP